MLALSSSSSTCFFYFFPLSFLHFLGLLVSYYLSSHGCYCHIEVEVERKEWQGTEEKEIIIRRKKKKKRNAWDAGNNPLNLDWSIKKTKEKGGINKSKRGRYDDEKVKKKRMILGEKKEKKTREHKSKKRRGEGKIQIEKKLKRMRT